MAYVGSQEEEEQAGILAAGERGLRKSSQRDAFVADQFLIEKSGALAGENFAEHVEHGIVLVDLVRPLVGDGHEGLRGRFYSDALRALLRRLDRSRTARQRTGRQQ